VDSIEKLFTFPGRGSQTFEAMKRLDANLGFPHRQFSSIHIGGTNGKGSVALKIAQGLQKEGFKVGLYTSPHIHSFRERILINGEMIPENRAQDLLAFIFTHVNEELSFFDLLTMLAFLYFAEEKIDWAVVEVGLGGRLDATNVIDPKLAIITSIGWDHMHLLGHSLEEIALQKKGIIKKGVPLIVGSQAAHFFDSGKIVSPTSIPFYDAENSATAKMALEELGISSSSIAYGIQFRPSCRFERLGNTILDVAHNSSGFEKLTQALEFHFPEEKFHFILAISKEKDWRSCVKFIEPYAGKISFVNGDQPRFHPLGNEKIATVLQSTPFRDVICGSFYIMDEARLEIQKRLGAR
jgi:dihydrofolate synthase/folylpolyglutamate synthase